MIEIAPGGLKGSLKLPPSKSHTLRAILFGSLASGTSTIENILDSPDTDAMIQACRTLGAKIERTGCRLLVTGGIDNSLKSASIDAGNSGIVLRFMGAIFALTQAKVQIVNDGSRRPCGPLIDALQQMGAICTLDPLTIQGPIAPARVVMCGADSQPVSAIMIAAAVLAGTTEIEVKNSGERPWLELTLDWLRRMGVSYEIKGENCYTIEGKGALSAFSYRVPSDLSSLAFMVAAALLTSSELLIEDVDLDDVQGDKIILTILEKMGAKFTFENKNIHIKGPQKLSGCDIDVNNCIDALPILATIGCLAFGKTHLYNGAIARKKESDRIMAMAVELKKMGAEVIELPDGLICTGSSLSGAELDAHKDHRVAMSLAVAALAAKGKSTISGSECVQKTYKNFFLEIERLKDRSC